MKHLKMIGLAAVAVMALAAFFGAGTASATELYKYTTPSPGDTLGVNTMLEAYAAPLEWETTGNVTVLYCTTSELNAKVENAGGAASHPRGKVTTLTLVTCSETADVIANGEFEVQHIAGTTNGTLISKNTEMTYRYVPLGISCVVKTGAGTTLGTITGAKSSTEHAVAHVNALLSTSALCGGDIRWTATYTIENPAGLTVEAS